MPGPDTEGLRIKEMLPNTLQFLAAKGLTHLRVLLPLLSQLHCVWTKADVMLVCGASICPLVVYSNDEEVRQTSPVAG